MARTKGAIAKRDDNWYMKLAVKEGYKAMDNKAGKPFGAIILKDGHLISKAYDKTSIKPSIINHSIITAIDMACRKLGTSDLSGCVLYTTTEPCLMCYGACINAKIDSIIYANVESSLVDCNYHEQRVGEVKVDEYVLNNFDSKELMAKYLLRRN